MHGIWSSAGYCTFDIIQQGRSGGYRVIARETDAIRIEGHFLDIPEMEDRMVCLNHAVNM